jgi:uncharacterized protein (DUF58 family)
MSTAPLTRAASTRAAEDPEVFMAIADLDLAGRGLADSILAGKHPSLIRGDGVEFHNHRGYQTGDDLRRVNWALYARHRRLYTRESRQESRRPVYLLADASASMSVQHGAWSKLHYATRALAGAAHLARRQGDAPALGILSGSGLSAALPPRSSAHHVTGICAALAAAPAAGPGNLPAALAEARPLFRQRGFVLFVSDFFDQEDLVLAELAACRARGHDVFALQVLDPLEVELPRSGDYDFVDPETNTRIRTSVESLYTPYASRVGAWRTGLRHAAESRGLRWHSTTTAAPLTSALREWLVN